MAGLASQQMQEGWAPGPPSPFLPPPPPSGPVLLLSFSHVSLMLVELGLVWAARDLLISVKNGVGAPCPPRTPFPRGAAGCLPGTHS